MIKPNKYIAPENAGAGSVPTGFTEVWQYGSNEAEPLDKQDGVAPQVRVKDLDLYEGLKKGGRVFIPNTEKKGFVTSHSIDNYGWIFNITPTGLNNKGYVKPR